MRLCEGAVLLLLLSLTWTRADPNPTPGSEECSKLETLKDKTELLGRFHFLAAFTDNDLFKALLGNNFSFWSNLTETETGVRVTQFSKMNGTCHMARVDMSTSGYTAKAQKDGITSEFHLLHLSNTSLIADLKASSSNITNFIQTLRLDPKLYRSDDNPGMNAHNYYLVGREAEPSETDLQQFRAHAKCAGFSGEPDFIYKSENGYCSEEESIQVPDDKKVK